MKKLSYLVMVCLNLNVLAQDVQQSYIQTDKNVDNCGFAGVIGSTFYTVTRDKKAKEAGYSINSNSCETMEMKESKVIVNDGVKMGSDNWKIVKLDDRLVLIVTVWKRDAPNEIYAKVIVNSNNEINAAGPLTLIKEWESPVYNGKKLTLGSEIFIVGPQSSDPGNKALVYYKKDRPFSVKDYDLKTDILSFVLIDKDLKVFDDKITDFEGENIPLAEPLLDPKGNFYVLPKSGILGMYSNAEAINSGYVFCYNSGKKSMMKKKDIFKASFKNGEIASSIQDARVKADGTLVYTGFYDPQPGSTNQGGLYIAELNMNSAPGVFHAPLSDKVFTRKYVSEKKNVANYGGILDAFIAGDRVVVQQRTVGLDKKGITLESVGMDYALFTKDANAGYTYGKTYSCNVGMYKTTKTLRMSTRDAISLAPLFMEDGNKLQMVFLLQKEGFGYDKLDVKPKAYYAVVMNTFGADGEMTTKYLYDLDPTQKGGPSPDESVKTGAHSWLITESSFRGFPVKLTF